VTDQADARLVQCLYLSEEDAVGTDHRLFPEYGDFRVVLAFLVGCEDEARREAVLTNDMRMDASSLLRGVTEASSNAVCGMIRRNGRWTIQFAKRRYSPIQSSAEKVTHPLRSHQIFHKSITPPRLRAYTKLLPLGITPCHTAAVASAPRRAIASDP
jgi:hypothetical protein